MSNALKQELIEGIKLLSKQPKESWWMPEGFSDRDEQRGRVGLSEFSSCIRRLYYQSHNVPESDETEAAMHLIWRMGDFIENFVIRAFNARGVQVSNQQLELNWNDYLGHMDGTLSSNDSEALAAQFGLNKDFLFECKSVKPDKMKKIMKQGCQAAAPDNYSQMQRYGFVYSKQFGKKLRGAVIVYVNKAASFKAGISPDDFYVEVVPLDDPEVEIQLETVRNILLQDVTPRREYSSPDVGLCPFCKFKTKCWIVDSEV